MKKIKIKVIFLSDRSLFVIILTFLIIELSSGNILKIGRKTLTNFAEEETNNRRRSDDATNDKFDKKILDMFGMTTWPSPKKEFHVPKLMQHLYKAHMGDFYEHQSNIMQDWEEGFDLPLDHVTSRTNTVRSFHHFDEHEDFPGIADHHIRLRFDLSSLPDKEVIGAAELLLHRQATANHLLIDGKHLQRINVYEIMKMNWSTQLQNYDFNQSAPITRLLDTRLVDSRNSSWERFDVTLASSRWAGIPHSENHGLLIEVVTEDGAPPSDTNTPHVRLKRGLHPEVEDGEWFHKKPTLLTYTNDGSGTNLKRKTRERRSSNNSSEKNNSKKREINSSRKKKKRKKRHRPCSRHNLYVSFADVGWNVWIVAPPGYNAFYCQGQCTFPLAEHLNATNHAIVQTLANSVEPLLVPRACCVPTQLSSISMLYEDNLNMVVLKSYPSMVVDACGCR